MLTIASLLLGLLAWILPAISMKQCVKKGKRIVLSFISLSACGIALCLQILNSYRLVMIEDWSALLDTMGAVVFAAAVLLGITIALNSVSLLVQRKRFN